MRRFEDTVESLVRWCGVHSFAAGMAFLVVVTAMLVVGVSLS